MSYKQALAWWATGDDRYANNALRIIDAWASTNQVSKQPDFNGTSIWYSSLCRPMHGGVHLQTFSAGRQIFFQ